MAAPTVQDVVKAAITELSQVPGLATQIYATPRLQQFVQNAFLLEQQEMWWPQLSFHHTIAIDPATGMLTADVVGPIGPANDYGDIRAVFPSDSNRALPELPLSMNPTMVTGSRFRFIRSSTAQENRPVRVLPAGVSGSVTVVFMQTPTMPMALTDKVYLDQLLLLYDACWMYAVDDGTVPAQVNKYQVLASNRRKKMLAQFTQHPLALDSRSQWQEMIDTGVGDGSDFFVLDQDPLA